MPEYYEGFEPMTPLGKAMLRATNLRMAGPSPNKIALEQARVARQQMLDKKTRQEIAAAEADAERRGSAYRRQSASYGLAMPLPKVNAIASYLQGQSERDQTWTDEDIAKVGRTLENTRLGVIAKSPNPANIQQGITRNLERESFTRALADPKFRTETYGPTMNAQAGRGQYAASTGINTFSGAADSPLAQAVVGLRGAQADRATAAASQSNARAREIDKTSRTGIRPGAPLIVTDESGGDRYAGAYEAVGEAPGARPAPRKPPEVAGGLPKKTRDELLTKNSEIDRILSFIDEDLVDASGTGTGALAGILQGLDATLGQVTPGQIAPDTQEAKQKLREFVQIAKTAIVNNPKFPVAEQQVVAKMLPDPDAFFKNPETAVQNLKSLRNLLIQIRLANEASIEGRPASAPTGPGPAPASPAAPVAPRAPVAGTAPAAAPATAGGAKDYSNLWGGR
jgi:hypothetical protein